MDVMAVSLQQAGAQTGAGLSMIKQKAQTEQALVDMIQKNAAHGGRGSQLEITV